MAKHRPRPILSKHHISPIDGELVVKIAGLDGAQCYVSARLLLDGSLHIHLFSRRRADISATEPER